MEIEKLYVYKSTRKLMEKFEELSGNINSKSRDYVIKIRGIGIEMFTNICMANSAVGDPRRRLFYLEYLLGNYESWRACKNMLEITRGLSLEQIAQLDVLLGEVGSQIMGWRNSVMGEVAQLEAPAQTTEDANA